MVMNNDQHGSDMCAFVRQDMAVNDLCYGYAEK